MKKALLLVPALLLFTGCGEVQFPENIPSPTPSAPVATSTPQAVNATPTTNIETGEKALEDITKERDNLSEAIKVTQEELRSCILEKDKLLLEQSSVAASSKNIEKYAPILEKYLNEVEQKEYPFTLCGSLGKATNQSWYPSFVASLDAKKILFSPLNRPLKSTDFGGVCASETGKVAIFLGASVKGKSEFHLVKYNIETKAVEEAMLLSGGCSNCPTKFGKRFGPVITLTSNSGKEYKYYYDSNIITE